MKYRRLYYLANTLDDTEKISKDLERAGVGYEQQHILSKHEGRLVRHHLHTAGPLEKFDIIHYGERGAIIGFLTGLLFVLLLEIFKPFSLNPDFWVHVGIWVLFTCFGAWAGGLVGTHRRNYRIAPLRSEIEAGKYIVLVDVHGHQIEAIKTFMENYHK